MKVQFSIAGVMGLTLIISLGLWSVLYANFLFAHVATTSLVAGGAVGWIVGACHGQSQRGWIAGALGGLLWTCGAALSDLHYWSYANRWDAWGGLAAFAALGAVPMASTVAAYDRSPVELVLRPMISCAIAALIVGFVAVLCVVVAMLLYPSANQWGQIPLWIYIYYFVLLSIGCGIGAYLGGGHGAAALLLRSLVEGGRKYRDAHHPKSIQPKTITAEHTDPATVDPQ